MYLIILSFLFSANLFAQSIYSQGDWTSFPDFRNVVAIDAGSRDIFVATTGGIINYNIIKKQWSDPMAVGYGFTESVPLGDPVLLFYDENKNLLWLATHTELLQFDLLPRQWKKIENHLWSPDERVVNIGVSNSSIYLETIPEKIFSKLFTKESPLPSSAWEQNVIRYKGTRELGHFSRDNDPLNDSDIRWRGLRSKSWPDKDKQQFPHPVLPVGYVMHPNGTLTDPQFMDYSPTDWITDKWGNLWMGYGGLGVVKSDVNLFQSEVFQFGPAGDNLKAFQGTTDGFWVGGNNQGDHFGISSYDINSQSWKNFNSRNDLKILSTIVNDFAIFNNEVWVATSKGLLSYNKERWKNYIDNNLTDEIRALAATPTQLWIGTAQGLFVRMGADQKATRVDQMELPSVNDVIYASDKIFVASDNGWYRESKEIKKFSYFEPLSNPIQGKIIQLAANESEIWAITDQGLMMYSIKSEKAESWLSGIWMQNQPPTCIAAGDKYVWIGANNGFYRFDKGKNEWIHYDTRDGLLDNHVQNITIAGDDLMICTASGLTRFFWNNPNRIK